MSQRDVAIVILAAGGSTRLGRPKQLLQFDGKSLIRRVTEASRESGAQHVIVVLGAEEDRIRPELYGLPVTIVTNESWEEGLSSSIRAGIKTIPQDAEAVLLVLCDQPRLTSDILNEIIQAYSKKPIVACEYAGTVGVPALFDRQFFPELMTLSGDRGAKQIIQRHLHKALVLPWPDGAIDMDTDGG